MGDLPRLESEASHTRLTPARRLVQSCPPELGQEIAVTGSVARGVADEHSDVEINLCVDAMPEVERRLPGGEPGL